MHETLKGWQVLTTIDKYLNDDDLKNNKIHETIKIPGNILLNEGINTLWTLVCGGAATAFNQTNTHIGVGDSATAVAATQTGLQAATNRFYKQVDQAPIFGTNQRVTFRTTFASAEANFVWNEWTIANGNSDAAVNLNRRQEAMGTKVAGSSWVITVDITLS